MNETGWTDDDQSYEINKREEIIANLTREKKLLLEELNHRMRNILQAMLSLLNTQTFYLNDQSALTAIRDCQRRLFAISLIHRKVYLGEEKARVAMRPYFHELVSYLSESFSIEPRIRIEQKIDEIDLEVSQAISLGLIINEALSNSMKYAFPETRSGVIRISFSGTEQGVASLTISDDGIGLPREFLLSNEGGLGLNLISGLAGDLDGSFQLLSDKGTHLTIAFKNLLSPGARESQSEH